MKIDQPNHTAHNIIVLTGLQLPELQPAASKSCSIHVLLQDQYPVWSESSTWLVFCTGNSAVSTLGSCRAAAPATHHLYLAVAQNEMICVSQVKYSDTIILLPSVVNYPAVSVPTRRTRSRWRCRNYHVAWLPACVVGLLQLT